MSERTDWAAVAAVWIVLISVGFALFMVAAIFVLPFVVICFLVWGFVSLYKHDKRNQAITTAYWEKDRNLQKLVVEALPVPEPSDFSILVLRRFLEGKKRVPIEAVAESMIDAVKAAYVLVELAPTKLAPASNDPLDVARWRDETARLAKRNADPTLIKQAEDTLIEALEVLYKHLPPAALTSPTEFWSEDTQLPSQTIPLYELIPNLPKAVEDVASVFFRDDDAVYEKIRARLNRNLHVASGADPDHPTKKLILPTANKSLTGSDILDTYLIGTPLMHAFIGLVPFRIPENIRFSGHWIVAPPNRGKTNLLHTMFLEDAQKDASIIILDSKGDLSNPIRNLAEFKDRLVVLEPDEHHPLALNPLDIGASTTHTIELLEYLFSALLDAKTTPLQATLFRSVLLLLKAVPNASFNDLRHILLDGHHAYAAHLHKLHPEDRDFFAKGSKETPAEFYSSTYKETKAQLLWRIRDLTTRIPILRSMLGAPRLLINMSELMDSGKIVVIDNSKQLLGDDGSEFVGRFFIALIRAAADQRSRRADSEKKPVYVYIDEAHNVIRKDEKIAGILQECRSQKIALIMAHQAISQIQSTVTLGALSDCAIRYANSDEEASQLAPRLRTTPEFLRSMGIGTFAAFVRDYANTAVRVDIPHTKLSERPQLSAEEQEILRADMRRLYCMPPMIGPPAEDTPTDMALGDLTPQPE